MSGIGRTVHRAQSNADIYHVTARGVAQQLIFEDERDRNALFELLKKHVKKTKIELYAWCFMGNHIHLVIHSNLETLSYFMQTVLGPYARMFNARHGRCGHLFQERFSSSPIDTDEYLMTAVRYVHQNPVGIGVRAIDRYRWSSYREYLGEQGFTSTDFVLGVFGGKDAFVEFHRISYSDQETRILEFEGLPETAPDLNDDIIQEAKGLLGVSDLAAITHFDKRQRDNMLVVLKARYGIRQTARLTGIGRNIVQRASIIE